MQRFGSGWKLIGFGPGPQENLDPEQPFRKKPDSDLAPEKNGSGSSPRKNTDPDLRPGKKGIHILQIESDPDPSYRVTALFSTIKIFVEKREK